MLVNMKELLSVANEHNFAVPALIFLLPMLKGVIETCEKKILRLLLLFIRMN